MTRSDIAHQLHLSPHTIREHIDRGRDKLGVRTVREAVVIFEREYYADE
jgi:DNA-binding CsgD family transcriptional regulator